MKTVEQKRLLVVEDSDAIRQEISEFFSAKNDVITAKNLAEAVDCVEKQTFDAVILDLVLPDGNGLSIFEHLRDDVPVIILSDLGSDENIIDGIGRGAADYIVKPVSTNVLDARLAIRLLPPKDAVICSHGLSLNLADRTAGFYGKTIDLTASEFNILAFLMSHPGQVFSALDIYEQVWKLPHLNTQTIRIHLHNLRKKLLLVSPACGSLIMTEFGKGYYFIP